MDISQNSFAAGELSENLTARQDLPAYISGLKECTNFFTYPTGHGESRKGTTVGIKPNLSAAQIENKAYKFMYYRYKDKLFIIMMTDEVLNVYEWKNNKITLLHSSPFSPKTPQLPFPAGLDVSKIHYATIEDELILGDGSHPLRSIVYGKESNTFEYFKYKINTAPTFIQRLAKVRIVSIGLDSSVPTFQLYFGQDYFGNESDEFEDTGKYTNVKRILIKTTDGTPISDFVRIDDAYYRIYNGSGAVGVVYKIKNVSLTSCYLTIGIERGEFEVDDFIGWYSSYSGRLTLTRAAEGTIVDVIMIKTFKPIELVGGKPKEEKEDRWRIRVFRPRDVGKYIFVKGGVLKITEHVPDKYAPIVPFLPLDKEERMKKALNYDGGGDDESDEERNKRIPTSYVKALVIVPPKDIEDTELWTLEVDAWEDGFYPNFFTVYQQRLVLGRGFDYWFSKINEFDWFFSQSTKDDDAFHATIDGVGNSDIRFMITTDNLIIGTDTTEWVVSPSEGYYFSINTFNIRVGSSYGSENHKPVLLGNELIFIQNGARKLRSLRYSESTRNYQGFDISYLVDHLTNEKLKKVVKLSSLVPTLYVLTEKGSVYSCVYDNANEIVAWSVMTQQYSTTLDIHAEEFNGEDILFITKKIYDSKGDYLSFEWHKPFERFNLHIDWNYLDSSFHYTLSTYLKNGTFEANKLKADHYYISFDIPQDDAVGTELLCYTNEANNKQLKIVGSDTSLDVVEPFTVYEMFTSIPADALPAVKYMYTSHRVTALIDGKVHYDIQPRFHFDIPSSKVVFDDIDVKGRHYSVRIGFDYDVVARTFPPAVRAGDFFLLGDKARISNCRILLSDSVYPVVNGQVKPTSTDETATPYDLHSGVVEYTLSTYRKLNEIRIENSKPLPLKVLGIYYKIR